MTVDFNCSCGKALRAESKFAGRWVKCPQCGNNVQVPQVAGGDPPAPAPAAGAAPAGAPFGAPAAAPRPYRPMGGGYAVQKPCGMATASLVLGLISLLCGGIVAILAVVFGAVALSQIGKNPNLTGKGSATAGIILGIVGFIVGIIATIFWVVMQNGRNF
jgi:hypothetical protein